MSTGFASWPKLKAHVEAAAASPPLFPRLTSKARECLFFARFEASHAGSPSIEPEHLLLGLMKVSQSLRNGLLAQVPEPLERARDEVAAQSRAPIPTSVPIPLGERTKRVFQGGAAEADRLRHTEIGLVHLLLGVLREPDSIATGFLERRGLRAPAIAPPSPRCGKNGADIGRETPSPSGRWRPHSSLPPGTAATPSVGEEQ